MNKLKMRQMTAPVQDMPIMIAAAVEIMLDAYPSGLSSLVIFSEAFGKNAADKAPSPKTLRNKFGKVKAVRKAENRAEVPKAELRKISLSRPVIRPVSIPVAVKRVFLDLLFSADTAYFLRLFFLRSRRLTVFCLKSSRSAATSLRDSSSALSVNMMPSRWSISC